MVLLDFVSDTRTSAAVQGVRALGQVHTSLSPEPNMDLWRTGKVVRVRPPKTRLFFNFDGEIESWKIIVLSHVWWLQSQFERERERQRLTIMNTIKIVGNLLLFFVVLAFPTSTSGFLAGLSDSGSYVQCTFPGDSTCTGQADPDGSQWLCACVSTVTGSACQMTCDLMPSPVLHLQYQPRWLSSFMLGGKHIHHVDTRYVLQNFAALACSSLICIWK